MPRPSVLVCDAMSEPRPTINANRAKLFIFFYIGLGALLSPNGLPGLRDRF